MFVLNSNKPIKVAHLLKLANQLVLNGALLLLIDMVNNSFSDARKTSVVWKSEKHSNWKKIRGMGSFD